MWYAGNETGQIPGSFPEKWWEGSALFMAALQYWKYTGDTTYNSETSQGLEHQSGDGGDYMPSNYSTYLVRRNNSWTTSRGDILTHSCREMMTRASGV